jgi:Uma2 family endonuclease
MSTATLTEPTAPPDEGLYEIVRGQRVELPPMSAESTWIASRLQTRIDVFAEEHRLGTVVTEMLFILDREINLRRRPDVAFVSVDRWPLDRNPPAEGDWDVVPDLAIEVVSPNDIFEDVLAKVGEYFEHGVRQVWVVAPRDQRVYLYDSRDAVRIVPASGDLETSVLPGWRLPLATLFRALANLPRQ